MLYGDIYDASGARAGYAHHADVYDAYGRKAGHMNLDMLYDLDGMDVSADEGLLLALGLAKCFYFGDAE